MDSEPLEDQLPIEHNWILIIAVLPSAETNIAPENGWLENSFPFGANGLFSGASQIYGIQTVLPHDLRHEQWKKTWF